MRPTIAPARLAGIRTPLHESDAMTKIKSIRRQGATPPLDTIRSSSASVKLIRPADLAASAAEALDEPLIAKVEAYLDTLELTYPRRPKGLLAEARAILGRPVWFKDISDAEGNRWGVRLHLHQPTPELLTALDKYGGSLSRFDIAFDIFPFDMSIELMAKVIRECAILRWRRPQAMFEFESTLYWTEWHLGQIRPDRNLAEYHDLPSKIDAGKPAVHLELRFQTSDAAKAQNLHRPSQLIRLNPRALFDKHIRILDFQQHIADDINSSANPGRVRGFYKRNYQRRVQLFKDRQPHLIKLLEPLNSRFAIKDHLTWGAVSGPKDAFTWLTRDQQSHHPSAAEHPSSVLIMQLPESVDHKMDYSIMYPYSSAGRRQHQ
ncbi:hypothetical protein IVB12_35915 [Bradyrhizobium sp. 179]|uniref:hypothetical protein n=1 Tax=Bradyrhizobium sp. 179 TaxID=2782648 RepID=UPI001FFA0718|nr:hypothetical protein [Bradyrhizobium sp. 179]MCK1547168.1 hypothetical protein [Bradyrhizobium sp. 179]